MGYQLAPRGQIFPFDVDPLLAVPDFRRALEQRQAPCVAISPVIKGAAVKGPTTKIMGELGLPQSSAAVATHYGNLLDGFIIDDGDTALATEIASEALRVRVAKTLMNTLDDRINLAHTAVKFISEIS